MSNSSDDPSSDDSDSDDESVEPFGTSTPKGIARAWSAKTLPSPPKLTGTDYDLETINGPSDSEIIEASALARRTTSGKGPMSFQPRSASPSNDVGQTAATVSKPSQKSAPELVSNQLKSKKRRRESESPNNDVRTEVAVQPAPKPTAKSVPKPATKKLHGGEKPKDTATSSKAGRKPAAPKKKKEFVQGFEVPPEFVENAPCVCGRSAEWDVSALVMCTKCKCTMHNSCANLVSYEEKFDFEGKHTTKIIIPSSANKQYRT
jgi:hypothetical protein